MNIIAVADGETLQIPSTTQMMVTYSSMEANANGFNNHEEDDENTDLSTSTENSITSSTSDAYRDETTESAFLTDAPIIDEDEEDLKSRLYTGPALYKPGELPRPRFVMLGQQGVGKVPCFHNHDSSITTFIMRINLLVML